MKTKLLELIEEIKSTGIAEVLCKASNAEDFSAAWQKFEEENPELFSKITEWATEFSNNDCSAIFEDGEEVEMPIETAICIYIMGETVTEESIFEDSDNLVAALCDIGEENAEAIANFIKEYYLYSIEPENIFCEEEAEDGEDAEEEDTADVADSDDGDETEIVSEDADADESEVEEDSEDSEGATVVDEAEADDDDGETEPEDGEEDANCGDADEADSDVNLAEAEDH